MPKRAPAMSPCARRVSRNASCSTTPSLTIARGSASTAGFAFVSIRGQGNLTPIIANDPAVATYIDGVYISRPAQGLTDLQDLERLEVLRGPQGTLFGRNTTGGAINLISKIGRAQV